MNTQQVEPPEAEDSDDGMVSVDELDNDDALVLELLKDLEGQALTKDEIAERLDWESPYRVSTTQTSLDNLEFYKVSSRYYDGTRYYYAELDKFKVWFVVCIVLFVPFFCGILASEYGLL